MRPLCPAAGVSPLVGRRQSGNHQCDCSIPARNQSDVAVRVPSRELRPRYDLPLRPKRQDVLRGASLFNGPGDGQVGGVGELTGDVAREREVTSLWDDLGRSLGGDLEGVRDDYREKTKNKCEG